MKIAMVASESNPLVKTGGLGDVVYALSLELNKGKNEAIIVLPYYKIIKDKGLTNPTYLGSYNVRLSWRNQKADVYKTEANGITYYLIDNDRYFNRTSIYGEYDDGERFAFFSLAAKQLFSFINYVPDVIHVHDWQVGMIPCLVKEDKSKDNILNKTKFVLTIHNPAFQGMLEPFATDDLYNLSMDLYNNGNLRFKDQLSTLKAGIVYADKITTVSPTHRCELLTPEESMGLDGVLRLRELDFVGILNGLDTEEFNPNKDSFLYQEYNGVNFYAGKAENKRALFEDLHIQDYGKPLFGMVSRLTWQKGMDLVFASCYELAANGCNIVILGSGEHQYEQMAEELRAKFPNNVAIYIGYSNELAHQIYAASDYFFMPSLFEPCGLGQLIAMRYGTLPIVRRTGGLRDSVEIYNGENNETATGFGFDTYDTNEMVRTAWYAYDNYWDVPLRKQLIRNAMRADFSWKRSCKEYVKIYKNIIK